MGLKSQKNKICFKNNNSHQRLNGPVGTWVSVMSAARYFNEFQQKADTTMSLQPYFTLKLTSSFHLWELLSTK